MLAGTSSMLVILLAVLVAMILSEPHGMPEEDGVLVLSNETLPDVLAKYQILVVKFFVPTCHYCRLLAPQYALAAEQLRAEESSSASVSVRLAKLDIMLYQQVGVQHGVDSVPTLRLFYNGKLRADYQGDKTAESIVRWLKQKSHPPVVHVDHVTDLEPLKKDNDVVVVGFFRDHDSAEARAFVAAAESLDLGSTTSAFALASSEELFAELSGGSGTGGRERGLLLFRRRDSKRVRYAAVDYSESVLRSVVRQLARSLVVHLDPLKALDVLLGRVNTLFLLFVGASSTTRDVALQAAENLAGGYDGKITFVAVDTDTDFGIKFAEQFLIERAQLPAYRLAVVTGGEFEIYKPDTEMMTLELIGSFLSRYDAGQLEPLRQSQALPADWDARPVKVLVGTNYEEVTRGSGKRVFVLLYAPRNRRCNDMEPVWEQLGEMYKDVDDLIIAKFNAKANEVKDLKVSTYPSMKLYLPEAYEEIDYVGDTTLDALRQFLDLNAPTGSQLSTEEIPSDSAEVTSSGYDEAPRHGEL